MSTIDKAEHDRIVAELNAKISEQGTTITDLNGRFEAQEKAARLAAVKALFTDTGREFKDELAAPYLGMSEEAFTAVAKDLRASGKPKLPANLSAEQAKGGEGGAGDGELKTVEDFQAAAKKFIADQAALGFTVDFTTAIAHLRRKQTAA